jgi:beta-lactamase class A
MRSFLWCFLLGLVAWPTLAQSDVLSSLPPCNFAPLNNGTQMRVGAVVYDFETGQGCAQRLDEVFNAASVPKLFVAGAYYDWLVQGLIRINAPLTFTRDYWMAGPNDCLREENIGTAYRGNDLLEAMINCSDNAATWMLMDAVGWGTVNQYIQSFGIPGIGEVVPYSAVDRMKLGMLDDAWMRVPLGLASRYYRAGLTAGLERFITPVPTERLTRREQISANMDYYLLYNTNTLTPRAMATYFMRLREAFINQPNSREGMVARLLFDVMTYTQRLNSVQALDGTVLVGGKNGFDFGIVAEANVVFNAQRIPRAIVIVFTQQTNLEHPDAQRPSPFRGPLNAYVRDLSDDIAAMLGQNGEPPPLVADLRLSNVLVQGQSAIAGCWQPYRQSGFSEAQVDGLEACFRGYLPQRRFTSGANAAVGVILRGLAGNDTRAVFVFNAPDGQRYSYQADRRYQDKTGIYMYHPVEQVGRWELDIYVDFQRVDRQSFFVE